MAGHVATTATAPARAAVRTALQTGIPAVLGLLVILPLIINEVLAGIGEQMPAGLYAWLAAAAAALTAASAMIARIMAIPGVIAFTRKYFAWAAPAPTPTPAPADTLAPATAGPIVYPEEGPPRD
jgi:hypothetical protein